MKEEYEKNIIIGTLNKFNGEKVKTAKYLGVGRTSLFEKIKKYNIDLLFGDENDNIKD